MSYKNGKEILPEKLLKELQKYAQGELIYIPRSDKERMPWGEMNGTRAMMDERNRRICCLYREGVGIRTLMEEFNLSEDSIRKIIWKNTKHTAEEELKFMEQKQRNLERIKNKRSKGKELNKSAAYMDI